MDFIKNNGFQFVQNSQVNTILLTFMLPVLAAFGTSIWEYARTLISNIGKFIYDYVLNQLKIKIMGKVYCRVDVRESDRLYYTIKDIIYNPNAKSDIKIGVLQQAFNLADTTDAAASWYSRLMDFENNFDIKVNYTGKNMFSFKPMYGASNNIEKKYFKHEKFVIRFTHFKRDKNDSNILVEVMTYDNKESDNVQKTVVIEKFLRSRFNIDAKLPYVYSISLNPNMNNTVTTFIVGNFATTSAIGLLKYGTAVDIKADQAKNDNGLNRKTYVSLKYNNITDAEMVSQDKFDIYTKSNDTLDDHGEYDFMTVYRKYVGPTNDVSSYGYYIKGSDIYMLSRASTGIWTLHIVLFGRFLTENDLRKELEFIMQTSLRAKSAETQSTKSNVSIHRYVSASKKWDPLVLDKRSFQTLYLPNNTLKDIKEEFDSFIQMEKLYREMNIPYRKGMLLHGPPGTGKTSLAKALAFEYQVSVYVIDVNDEFINDNTIIDVMGSMSGGGIKILLFEDIDTAFADKEKMKVEDKVTTEHGMRHLRLPGHGPSKEGDGKVEHIIHEPTSKTHVKFLTYSGLLQALDGALSNHHGVITIMTTNYLERLGQAILRPGRIDRKFELKECNDEQIVQMARNMCNKRLEMLVKLPNHVDNKYRDEKLLTSKIDEFVSRLVDPKTKLSTIRPCELQQYLLKHIESIDALFNNYTAFKNDPQYNHDPITNEPIMPVSTTPVSGPAGSEPIDPNDSE
jgi:hypothetical protein